MCLIYLWTAPAQAQGGAVFRLAANRDEFLNRPAQTMQWRTVQGAEVLCGLDEQAGGTWLALSRTGRFAAVTNVRQGIAAVAAPRSRGELPLRFVTQTNQSPQQFLGSVAPHCDEYGPFNLVIGQFDADRQRMELAHLHSPTRFIQTLLPGAHVISNADLDSAWPKAERVRQRLTSTIQDSGWVVHARSVMCDATTFAPGELPDTGVGTARERALSSVFVRMGEWGYGTRCTTLLTLAAQGHCVVQEVSYAQADANRVISEAQFDFEICTATTAAKH